MYNDYKRRKHLGLDPVSKLERKLQRLVERNRGLTLLILAILAVIVIMALTPSVASYERPSYVIPDPCELDVVVCEGEADYEPIEAYVTGYNTVPEQTDDTPCLAAGGHICGRDDVVACPTYLELGTKVKIDGKIYECLDRTAPKYNGRYDISCDKDMACPNKVTGHKTILVIKD